MKKGIAKMIAMNLKVANYDILIAVLCMVSGGVLLKGGKQIWNNQNRKNSENNK